MITYFKKKNQKVLEKEEQDAIGGEGGEEEERGTKTGGEGGGEKEKRPERPAV